MTPVDDSLASTGTGHRQTAGRWRTRSRLTALFTTMFVVASMLVVQGPAQADYVGTNYLRNWATGRCLETNQSGQVYTNPCTLPVGSNPNQSWTPRRVGHDGYDIVILTNVATDRCLLNVDIVVAHYGCENVNLPNFAWGVKADPWYQMVLENEAGNCLDSNHAGQAYLHACNWGGHQKWRFGY
ncbi:RICIN domain-containing protein [Micromonospora sp. NBC_01813]|uniref:RICIN domain-containing protein n=1 Tax=Micromonospora sp. NBC_01813 TaxID=2975988 RepID=UPI002DD96F49|nr:hypothetical protein [Micromonospora sp. NBC_01813]WSA11099.1 RICIN domain-containing protein [Micromonospora sp. NBC_01813]